MIERSEFEFLADELANAIGMIRDTQRQIDAHALVAKMVIRTVDDRWPGMRRIICDDIWEAIREKRRRFALTAATNTPELIEDHEEEIEVFETLVATLEVEP